MNHARNSKIHNALVDRLKTTARIANEDLTLYANGKMDRANVVTARVFRGVWVCLQGMGASMNSLPQMIQLMQVHQTIVGTNCGSAGTLTKIGISMSDSMHGRLCTHVQTTPLPMVLLFDGSNDICKLFCQGSKNRFVNNLQYFSANKHYLSVHVGVVEGKGRIGKLI